MVKYISNSITISKEVDVEIDVSMSDIIEELHGFSKADLKRLYDELIQYVDVEDDNAPLKPTSLYEEMKMNTLIEINNKYSLNELEEFLKNKKEGYGV